MATSADRREARYRRRKARRELKAQEAGGASFDEVMSFGNLCKAGKACCNGARWKTSAIHFETDLLSECFTILENLQSGDRKFDGFLSFSTVEHGKLRHIDALPIQGRAEQKCLCNNILTKAYSRSFIYENGASLEGKGMDFQLRILKKQLRDHYRKYGAEGGIYQFDFKNYFGSLPHEKIKARAREKIKDDRLYSLFCSYVDDFRLMKTADRSAKIKRGVGRYMDDGYVISDSLEELEQIRKDLYKFAERLGLEMNDEKNIITPFRHHSFRFLKMRVTLSDSGKVVMKLSRKSIKAMRRKMIIFRRWADEGRIAPEDIFQSYQSWRSHAKRCNSYHTLKCMDEKFVNVFKKELAARKKVFKCNLKAVRTRTGWEYYERGTL